MLINWTNLKSFIQKRGDGMTNHKSKLEALIIIFFLPYGCWTWASDCRAKNIKGAKQFLLLSLAGFLPWGLGISGCFLDKSLFIFGLIIAAMLQVFLLIKFISLAAKKDEEIDKKYSLKKFAPIQ